MPHLQIRTPTSHDLMLTDIHIHGCNHPAVQACLAQDSHAIYCLSLPLSGIGCHTCTGLKSFGFSSSLLFTKGIALSCIGACCRCMIAKHRKSQSSCNNEVSKMRRMRPCCRQKLARLRTLSAKIGSIQNSTKY